ncbi:hypothetical protein AB0C02_30385 [Micromonospora sp. NPDC048999]|uniref:hypothetical protein n=1 Tax=Micromonospora sp. NPDC048999 TaxID=3155391 RepID=UPI0033EFE470
MPAEIRPGMRVVPSMFKQGLFSDVQIGREQVTFAAATFHSRTITFPRTFAAAPTIVIPVINSGASEADRWIARVFSVTATNFGLSLAESTNASRAWTAARAVDWIAILL